MRGQEQDDSRNVRQQHLLPHIVLFHSLILRRLFLSDPPGQVIFSAMTLFVDPTFETEVISHDDIAGPAQTNNRVQFGGQIRVWRGARTGASTPGGFRAWRCAPRSRAANDNQLAWPCPAFADDWYVS